MNEIKKAIELMKNEENCIMRNKQGCDRKCNKCNLVKTDAELILAYETAVSVLEKQLNGGWILVSERLPNEKECNRFDDIRHPNYRKFLCTIKIADYESQIRELYLSKIFGWKYGPEDYNEYVIAWQPLPEKYREVENE